MPNALAQLALLGWPLFGALLFATLRPSRAVLVCMIGGYLVLPPMPAQFDLPLIPSLDKNSLPVLTAFLGLFFVLPDRRRLMPRDGLTWLLLALVVLSPMLTVLGNQAATRFGLYDLPGLTLKDGISTSLEQVIVVLPLLVARACLADDDGPRALLGALALAGVLYLAPILIELAIGPRINILLYGFFQHSMDQMIRNGGYRPIVFLPHALWLAFFMMTSLLAVVALARSADGPRRVGLFTLALVLFVVLVLCKSWGPIGYGVLFAPIVALASRRMQVRLAAALGAFVIAYPAISLAGLFPHQALVDLAARFSPDRAQSLGFRFGNDAALLDRVSLQPLVGWGGWGRNLIHNPVTGRVETITDGQWIVTLSMQGWIGFLSLFGLLALPLFRLVVRARGTERDGLPRAVAALALALGVNMADMLLNGTLTPMTWMVCGLLLGWVELWKPRPVAPAFRIRTVL